MNFYALFNPDSFISHLGDIALLLLVVFLCYSLTDKYLSRFIKVVFSSGLEKFVFLEGIGLGIFAYLVLGLGLCGLLYKWIFIVLLLLALFLVRERIYKLSAFFGRIRIDTSKIGEHWFEISASLIFAAFFIANLIGALAPTTGWDELTYHLAVPKLYVQHHQIYRTPDIMFGGWIMAQHMLYVFSLLVKSDILAHLFHLLMGILTAVATYSLSRNYFSKKASLLASLIFYSVPVVASESFLAYADLGLAFFELLAVYSVVKWLMSDDDNWMALSGIFCGLALGTKFLGVFCYISIILLILVAGKRARLKAIGYFSAIAFAVSFIWYLKNYLYTHDPFFPLLNNIFHSDLWYTTAVYYGHSSDPFGAGKGLLSYLMLPWNMTMKVNLFMWTPVGPLFLMFLPVLAFLLLFGKIKIAGPVLYISIYSLPFFLMWGVASQLIRFIIPLFPLLAILTSYTIFTLASSYKKATASALLVFVLILVSFNHLSFLPYSLRSIVFSPMPPLSLKASLGMISREQYLTDTHLIGYSHAYPAIKYVNENLPADARVLTLWGFDRYDYNRDILCDYEYSPEFKMCLMDLFWPKIGHKSWEEFIGKIRALRVTHLVISFDSSYFINNAITIDGFNEMAQKDLKLLYSYRGFAKVYEVRY